MTIVCLNMRMFQTTSIKVGSQFSCTIIFGVAAWKLCEPLLYRVPACSRNLSNMSLLSLSRWLCFSVISFICDIIVLFLFFVISRANHRGSSNMPWCCCILVQNLCCFSLARASIEGRLVFIPSNNPTQFVHGLFMEWCCGTDSTFHGNNECSYFGHKQQSWLVGHFLTEKSLPMGALADPESQQCFQSGHG